RLKRFKDDKGDSKSHLRKKRCSSIVRYTVFFDEIVFLGKNLEMQKKLLNNEENLGFLSRMCANPGYGCAIGANFLTGLRLNFRDLVILGAENVKFPRRLALPSMIIIT
uniref:Uncharacterized protein n=1 Tax=Romanomermis culicivorax TaxID=13658 RepID=A0A915IGD3_ROMCU